MGKIHAAPQFISLVGDVTEEEVVRDFSRYDAYFDLLGVIYLNDSQSRKVTRAKQLVPVRQDIGDSRFEIRTDFGNHFGQGDFVGGANQQYFHRPDADDTAFLDSEGFDVSQRGKLTHLNEVLEDGGFSTASAAVRHDDKVFFANGNNVVRGDGAFPGTYTSESPHAADSAVPVLDLAASGDALFAALGVNGVHARDAGGTWAHYQPDGASDLNVGDARVVAWLKDRLMVVGTAGTEIFEVVADSTPTALETLADGWAFVDMFESGPFIFAVAVNTKIGQSRVHTYGLTSDGSAIEKKTSTPLPNGDIARCGLGYLGRIFIGGGRQNSTGGYDAFLYEAQVTTTGDLALSLIAADDSAGASDLSVRCIEALPSAIVFGWSTGDRSGLGIYHLARNAFAKYLNATDVMAAGSVTSVLYFKGRTVFTMPDGLVYEDLGNPVTTATLVSSIADWDTTSPKTWDFFELHHSALVTGQSVKLEYTIVDPELDEWVTALTSGVPGAAGKDIHLRDIIARNLAVRVTSTGNSTSTPEVQSFDVRSTLSPTTPDWELVRTIRVVDKDKKDRRGEWVHQDPRAVKNQIAAMLYTWLTVYEPDATFDAYVEDVQDVEPASDMQSATGGTALDEAYYVQITLVGRRQ
jgi:hypothetical protein